ncbi:MAG: AarF/ABC1/UbiB kinase family protein, partial [Cyanobacteriota bacterium]|nr:AarF/ABC1/UbiB kinase family protein [Cyanobacteriota bacterium]
MPAETVLDYNPNRDLRWLLLRPWIALSRLVVVLLQLLGLAIALVVQGNSADPKVQERLAGRILRTLTNL